MRHRRQAVDNQRGEILFRRTLVRQQTGGPQLLEGELDRDGIERRLHTRMERTLSDMRSLESLGVRTSPYLELGAERCQRSLVMENDLGVTGVAADISLDMLESCVYYQQVFGKKRAPWRICCDAYDLPFRTGSIPFVFCYETLHHFPDPIPVVREVHRVLAPGGWFFFAEEPYRRFLHARLYKSAMPHSARSATRTKLRTLVDYFLSDLNSNEVSFGVIENLDIPVGLWRRALEPFAEKYVELATLKGIRANLFGQRLSPRNGAAVLFGGSLGGRCRKAGCLPGAAMSVADALVCPDCRLEAESSLSERSAAGGYKCGVCGASYRTRNDVALLLRPGKLAALYPELLAGAPLASGSD